MKIAVVGGGLVGRICGWAVMQAGHAPVIFDRMRHAVTPRGFVYEHQAFELPLHSQTIEVLTQGTVEDYAKKVYGGKLPIESVSFGKYVGTYEGYDPAELLACLNGLQEGMLLDANFETLEEVLRLRDEYERIIFTLPLRNFIKGNFPCVRGSVGAWKLNEGEDLRNFCVYNASLDIPWYRSGSMFGWAFREFPIEITGHRPIVKVMDGDPPPEHENVLFTGRFGRWSKTELSHTSYERTLRWLT